MDENAAESLTEEYCAFYDCWDLMPVAKRILNLYSIKESLGHIPWVNKLSYMEIRGIVILKEEIGKYEIHESYKIRQQHEQQQLQVKSKQR